MLAVIGYAVILVMMFLILKDKALPATCFVFLPVIGALLAGFGVADIAGFISKGVGTTWPTAILFVFSILYFGIMNYAGLFDKLVDYLLKMAGDSITMILLAAAIIAIIGHIDGATTSTYLITIPVMLPIFKKMKLRPTVLLLIVSCATGVMNLVPWGGPTLRAATAIGADATQLWITMIPMQIFGIVCTLAVAVYFSHVEKKRLAAAGALQDAGSFPSKEQPKNGEGRRACSERVDIERSDSKMSDSSIQSLKRPKLLWFNLLLTIAVIILLVENIFPAYAVFMFGMLIAISVNYPNLKTQQEIICNLASGSIGLVVTLIGAGVFLGIFVNTGMIESMAQVLIQLIPDALQKYLHIIAGILGAPMGMVMGPDPYYYGVLPLITETVARFGITPDQVAHSMLIGENVALAVSPCVPTTFLAMGLAGVELKDHIRFSFKWLWGISILMLIFALIIGIV